MSWFSGVVENVGNFFTGDKDKREEADKLREKTKDIKNKSTSELQKEGRAAAGQAAADKAGIAKSQAKAASMQANGNRLQAATNAASAAQQASTEGYDTASQGYTNIAAQQDAQEKAAQRDALNSQANSLDSRVEGDKNRRQQFATTAMTMAGSLSDKGKKCVKHTYIPSEKRVRRGE